MNQMLNPNQTVRLLTSGSACTVEQFLGGGGQGEVYRARLNDQDVALKWYFPAQATLDQRAALGTLMSAGAPNTTFLWPLELAAATGVTGFGYIMPLREPRFKGFIDLMKRRIDPTFRTLATVGLEMANSYLHLHARGFCYRDISFGNVFFDPTNGDILIGDNDNVTVNGTARGGVLGTPRFMAPEVVRGDVLPSTQTDLFSLAVLLFYMFMVHHPLEGKKESAIRCFDLPAMTKLYGTEPLFIFDPDDDSNQPVPGLHDNALTFWPIYPQFLRDLFIRSFTDGIRDPEHGRVRESEWRTELVQLRDAILYCGSCGAENFYDSVSLSQSGGTLPPCWACGATVALPPRIRIEKQVIMLNHDTQLFPHHIDETRLYDFGQPVAEVSRHPSDPSRWGLRNLSSDKWVCTLADGSVRDVEPSRNVPLAVGTKVNFGRSEGEIRL
ncbi:MAG: serine/threonine protein kinase [Chloroflexaceae bacterium]|nr:serine/threonine protein kinase [Chloroflexaceae bacterium]